MKKSIIILLLGCISYTLQAQEPLRSGIYYIQNIETGTYLSSGANWGTRAVMSPHGVDIKVSVINGQYNLVTQIQGADKALRPSDGYMDQSGTWTVEPLIDGTYALYNGTNYFGYDATYTSPWIPRLSFTDTNGINTHWKFWSKQELIETLADATKSNPVDATFFIQAPDFLIGDYRVTGTKVWGNDLTSTGGNTSGDSYMRNCAVGERYDSPSFNITQTIEGLPSGIYSLSVQGFYRYGNQETGSAAHNNGTEQLLPRLYAGSQSEKLPSLYSLAKSSATGGWAYSTAAGYVPNTMAEAAACFDSDENAYLTKIENIVVVDGKLTIGIRKSNRTVQYDWTCFDNFTLMYHGCDADDISAMKSVAIQKIEEYEALNTTSDPDFAEVINAQKTAVENAESAEAISDAIKAVENAYKYLMTKAEPTDKPLDFTDTVIKNANLEDGTDYWEAIAPGYTESQPWAPYTSSSNSLSVLETYAGLSDLTLTQFSLLQDVPLSPGMYRLKGYAFYRYQDTYHSDLISEGQEISNAYLIAGEHRQKVMRLGDVEQDSYANTMSEAAGVFKSGQYLNTLVFEVTEPSVVKIGYTGEHTAAKSWFICGPFVLEKINAEILQKEAEKEFINIKRTYSQKWQAYKTISAQALDHEAFDLFIDEAKASTANFINQGQLEDKDAEVWDALCTLLRTGTTATGQFDITSLVTNPTFTKNTNGWAIENGIGWSEEGLVEIFNKKEGVIRQTLKKMPAGLYTMKVQAFYRMTSYGTSSRNYENGQDVLAARMFFGDESTPIKSINSDGRYRPTRQESDVEGAFGKTIPNTFNGANAAFGAKLYWNILRANLAEDGDVEMGIRYADGLSYNWLAFDNFKLYYGKKAVDVNMSRDEVFNLKEDTYANITNGVELKAGQLNPLCLPFDMDASKFESVWTIADAQYDAENKTLACTLVPVHEIKAGIGYFVKVKADTEIKFDDIIIHAADPDSVPLLWEGGALTGVYGKSNVLRSYVLSDDGSQMEYNLLKRNHPGYAPILLLPSSYNGKAKTAPLTEIDFSNVDIKVNLENYMAREFLQNARYNTLTSSTVIAKYNSAPPARRDAPHTVIVPVPYNNIPSFIEYSLSEDFSDATTVHIPANTDVQEIANLIPQRTYYYRIIKGKDEVSRGQIHTDGNLRMIKATSGSNIRDLGGWLTLDGNRVNYGLVYRGGEMNGGHVMNDADKAELLRLGIGAEVDLRSDADFSSNIFTQSTLGTDVPYIYANQTMFNEDALEQDVEKYGKIFPFILNNLRNGRSVYFHCIWGADRTGAMAFLLEGLIGLTMDQLYKDYELTTYSIAGLREKTGLDGKFTYIAALPGNNLQHRFFNYWKDKVGMNEADLLEFIERMTNGTSSLVTEIKDVSVEESTTPTATYYSLDGRQTNTLQKGINIIKMSDGSVKKVLVK